MHRALLVTGVAGVGKTTIAREVGGLVTRAGGSVAVIDTDDLAQFAPGSIALPASRQAFYDDLKCKNLAAVWSTYQTVGAHYVVVSGGIDTQSLKERYAESLVGCNVEAVLLTAPLDTLRERLLERDVGAKLARHLRTLEEDDRALRAARLEDFTVVNDRPSPVVAQEVVDRARWVLSPSS